MKMKPLPTSQQVMEWLSMSPADDSTSKKVRLYHAALTLFAGILNFVFLLSDLALVTTNLTIDIEKCLYAVFQVGAHTSMLNLIIVGLINRNRVAAIFTKLAKLYNASKKLSEINI